jgi:hypothetical protein
MGSPQRRTLFGTIGPDPGRRFRPAPPGPPAPAPCPPRAGAGPPSTAATHPLAREGSPGPAPAPAPTPAGARPGALETCPAHSRADHGRSGGSGPALGRAATGSSHGAPHPSARSGCPRVTRRTHGRSLGRGRQGTTPPGPPSTASRICIAHRHRSQSWPPSANRRAGRRGGCFLSRSGHPGHVQDMTLHVRASPAASLRSVSLCAILGWGWPFTVIAPGATMTSSATLPLAALPLLRARPSGGGCCQSSDAIL